MQFDADQIAGIVRSMQLDQAAHMRRLRVRRLLIEMTEEATTDNGTGTHVVPPFDESKMIIKTLIGEPVKEVQRYASRIASNPPQPHVFPVTVDKHVTKTMRDNAAEQERLMNAMWVAAKGPSLQRRVAWSASWGRVGWYLTMPRDLAWGAPDREFYEDLTDDEIEAMKRKGLLSPSMLEDPRDGQQKWAESAESWIERRKKHAVDMAVAGQSLNTLEALPPDVVYARRDIDGIKYAAVVQEVPGSDFRAGTEEAKAIARYMGVKDAEEIQKFSLYVNKDGKVEGGVTSGSEPTHAYSAQTWTLVRFFTRSEVYYALSGTTDITNLTLIWHDEHGDGVVPVIPAPFAETDSLRPGGEYTCPFEAMAAYAPLVNQVETLLSNVAAYNALARWVVEDESGRLVMDPETGKPLVIEGDRPPDGGPLGTSPEDTYHVPGRVKQLVIDATLLLQLLQFYAERMDSVKIPDVAVGAGGTSGAAWTTRQQIAQTQIDLMPAVNNHAEAIKSVFTIWINRARKLDMPLYMFSLPGNRHDEKDIRGLIEFDPSALTVAFEVRQDPNTPADRVVLKQQGQEELAAGLIDDFQYHEEFALAQDAKEAVMRSYAHRVAQFVLLGDTSMLQPGSVLHTVAQAVQGRLTVDLFEHAPNLAIAQAERMAQQATAASVTPIGEGGNPAQAQGITLGQVASPTLPGSPEMGEANIGPRPTQSAGVA